MCSATSRMRDHAYFSFTERLLSLEIKPGQIVSQRELVELTGMSLGAVREMIPRLEADGLIRTVPQRGLQVVSIDLALIRDAFQLRRIIESEAIAQFCRTAQDATLAQLLQDHNAVLEKARDGVTAPLLDHAQRLDWAFHDLIVDEMGNALISEVYRVNSIKIRLIRNSQTRMLPELVSSVMEEHLPIVQAVQARDEAAAVAALHAHIDSARRRALSP